MCSQEQTCLEWRRGNTSGKGAGIGKMVVRGNKLKVLADTKIGKCKRVKGETENKS